LFFGGVLRGIQIFLLMEMKEDNIMQFRRVRKKKGLVKKKLEERDGGIE